MKLRITDGSAIEYPISICAPLNADFDGDTVSISLVPPEMAEDTYQKMSPRYVTYYKKNLQPIPEINHETLELGARKRKHFINCWNGENPNQQLKENLKFNDYI